MAILLRYSGLPTETISTDHIMILSQTRYLPPSGLCKLHTRLYPLHHILLLNLLVDFAEWEP